MRALGIVLSLSLLLPAAAPVHANTSANHFASMESCERYFERGRVRLDRLKGERWDRNRVLFDAAYCEERDGRFFAVFPF